MVITINESIKQDIAQRACEQDHPGYSKDAQGEWFVINGDCLKSVQSNAAWMPWNDDDEVISVDALVKDIGGAEGPFGAYARTEIDWSLYESDYPLWVAAYTEKHGAAVAEEAEEYEIISWAEGESAEWARRIDEIEREQFEGTVAFALDYVPASYDTADLPYEDAV